MFPIHLCMSRVVFANGRLWAVAPDGSLRHKVVTQEPPQWEEAAELPSPVRSIAACDDRIIVYAACIDGSLHAFDARTGDLLRSGPITLHDVPLCILPLSIENALYVGLQDGTVDRCHLGSLAFDCMLGCGNEHKEAVNALEADDTYLYSAGEDATVLVWDLKQGSLMREISMAREAIRSMLRMDNALWLGLADGSVQVFDIMGDDSNGIELIADKAPHTGPVSHLVQVGKREVWSVAGLSTHTDVSQEYIPNVAKWDTIDMTYTVVETLKERDLMSIAVIKRSPFEEIAVVAIGNSLDSKTVHTTVKGRWAPFLADDGSDNADTLMSDPGDQTWESGEGLDNTISSPEYHQGLSEPLQDKLIVYEKMPHTAGSTFPPDEEAVHTNKGSKLLAKDSAYGEKYLHILPRSTSQALLGTMRQISQLLATLLTDNVLSEESHSKDHDYALRMRVATITQELNTGMQLIESSPVLHDIDSPFGVADENNLMRNNQSQNSSCCETTTASFRFRLQKELMAKDRLEKDLRIMTDEKDMIQADFADYKEATNNSLSTYEDQFRDLGYELSAKKSQNDSLSQENENLNANLQKVQVDLRKAATECENEKQTAANLIENSKGMIESQKDTILKLESKNLEFLEGGRALLANFEFLGEQQKKELSTLQETHKAKIRDLESKHMQEINRVQSAHAQELFERDGKSVEDEQMRTTVQSLKKELESANAELARMRREGEEREMNIQNFTRESVGQFGGTDGISKPVEEGTDELRQRLAIVSEELVHRKSAAVMYEEETHVLQTGVSKYKAAAEELREALSTTEEEKRSLEEEIRRARKVISVKEVDAAELRVRLERLEGSIPAELILHDNSAALRALLDSANGEIEQMSKQIDAMHVVQAQQERELVGLREAVGSCRSHEKDANEPQDCEPDSKAGEDNNAVQEIIVATGNVVPNQRREKVTVLPVCRECGFGGSGVCKNGSVNEAILEVRDGMDVIQEELRNMSNKARKYKHDAEAHLVMLPALHELEAELLRIAKKYRMKANTLRESRGVVQSIIAQYYSTADRQTALLDCDEALYIPSPTRLEALWQAVIRMRAQRTGSAPIPIAASVASAPQLRRNVSFLREGRSQLARNDVETPRRSLTFN